MKQTKSLQSVTANLYCLFLILAGLAFSANAQNPKFSLKPATKMQASLSKASLKDKIKGAWAGQTIGVTFGGPTEFRYRGVMIPGYVPIAWTDTTIAHEFNTNPSLYDDLYMDFTFMEVLEKEGLKAPADAFAQKFANAGYILWHANQRARNNILGGMKPPASGNWRNNPYADDIDFQIEADFIGIMCPGLPKTAMQYADPIGHIMNSGDGYYGGLFVATMYAEAFINESVADVVAAGLRPIPTESEFHHCIADAIKWHKQYPDWRDAWFQLEKKYANERGCPKGVFDFFNIDAKLNAAYVVLGLLYGEGDFNKTMQISTRCGQDSDCNPSTAGGILGTILGYDKIPEIWKTGLKPIENKDFQYTNISLQKAGQISYKHALQNLKAAGVDTNSEVLVYIPQQAQNVKLEQNFKGYYPKTKTKVGKRDIQEYTTEFIGNGIVLLGGAYKKGFEWADDRNHPLENWVTQLEVKIDGKPLTTIELPISRLKLRQDLFAFYGLKQGPHAVSIKVLNPKEGVVVNVEEVLIYGDMP